MLYVKPAHMILCNLVRSVNGKVFVVTRVSKYLKQKKKNWTVT